MRDTTDQFIEFNGKNENSRDLHRAHYEVFLKNKRTSMKTALSPEPNVRYDRSMARPVQNYQLHCQHASLFAQTNVNEPATSTRHNAFQIGTPRKI